MSSEEQAIPCKCNQIKLENTYQYNPRLEGQFIRHSRHVSTQMPSGYGCASFTVPRIFHFWGPQRVFWICRGMLSSCGWVSPSDCPWPLQAAPPNLSIHSPPVQGFKEWKLLSLHPLPAAFMLKAHQWETLQITKMGENQKPHSFSFKGMSTKDKIQQTW